MEGDSCFPFSDLSVLYSQYCVESVFDHDFDGLFNSFSDMLLKIHENRDMIDTCVIHSGRAEVTSIPIKGTSRYVLVWDQAYWEFYKSFVRTFCSLWNVFLDNTLSEEDKNARYFRINGFFTNTIINYLIHRFPADDDFCAYMEKCRVDSKFSQLFLTDFYEDESENLLWIGKEFLLMHELEHVLYKYSPEVFAWDSQSFNEIIDWYHDTLLPLIDDSIIPNGPDEFKEAVEWIQKNKNSNYYVELFNDFHSFFEVLDYHRENYHDTNKPFTSKSQSFLFGVKLLKMFDSCKTFLTRSVEKALSTKYYPKKKRCEQVKKVCRECQSSVYRRDYLAVELMFARLLLHAERFPGFNMQSFSKLHDTMSFTSPYSNFLQPLLNELTTHIVNTIIEVF